jgi:hypothetical protein
VGHADAKARRHTVIAVNAIDIIRTAVFLDPSRFPHRRTVDFFPLDPRRVDAGVGAGRENAPGRCDSFRGGGRRPTASRGQNNISKAAAASVEHKVFDLADILSARVLDFGTDDVAALDITCRGCGGALGLCEERINGQTRDGQSCS